MKKSVNENNLRVITIPVPSSKTVTVLVLTAVGSKYENKKISGISHFLEHMYFKGTKKRPGPKAVAETLDKIGGSYNAFTGEEYTGYYAKVASPFFETAIDWVSDIFLNSKIPDKELMKEKGVIIEEINMIKDHPTSYVQEVWTNLLYGDQPAGWSIAGTKKSVSSITRNDLISYMKKGYVASSTIVCISGGIDQKTAEEKAFHYFSKIPSGDGLIKNKTKEKQNKPAIKIDKRKTDQTHICLGFRAYDTFHQQRYALSLIETVLGKMMSSRMFVRVREELGLAYYVRTTYDASTDTGFLVTQAGVDSKKTEKAVSAILKEYKNLADKKIQSKELEKAKENIKGRALISLESSDAQAYFYGKQELLRGKTIPMKEIFKEIDKVTAEEIQIVSKDIFKPENLNLAMVGPSLKEKEVIKIINSFKI